MTRCRAGVSLSLLLIATACTTGCAPDRVVVKPQTVQVPVYVREPIPESLTTPIKVNWPDGTCWNGTERVLCNGQLANLLIDYREALDRCNADRAALTH